MSNDDMLGDMEILNKESKPSIFEYEDYRLFLRDIYQHLKRGNAKYSFRFLSRRAGFASPNFLKLVMDGQRNLSTEGADKCAGAFGLSKSEREFFKVLVAFGQANTASSRIEHAENLMKSRGARKIQPLTSAQYSYYANWYCIPIREMVGMPDFKEDCEWISARLVPSVSPEKVVKALVDLEALGLLGRDESGRLRQAHHAVNTPNEVTSASIVKYHLEMMRLAGESISNVSAPRREISSACVLVSQTTAERIKGMIQQFRAEILALVNEDHNQSEVYQLNFQLFPLTKVGPLSDREPEK